MLASKRKFLYIALTVFFLASLSISFVSADLEIDYPQVPGATTPQDTGEDALPTYIAYLFRFALWGIGFVFAFSLALGGLRYFLSSGNVAKMIEAREQISSAFWGIAILLSSFLILNTINPQIVKLGIKEIEKLTEEELEKMPPYPSAELKSLIATEVPFGKIIEENILETKEIKEEKDKRNNEKNMEEWEKQNQWEGMSEEEKKKSRMERIGDIASNFLELAKKLEEQNEELKNKSNQCSCSQTDPCCEHKFSYDSSFSLLKTEKPDVVFAQAQLAQCPGGQCGLWPQQQTWPSWPEFDSTPSEPSTPSTPSTQQPSTSQPSTSQPSTEQPSSGQEPTTGQPESGQQQPTQQQSSQSENPSESCPDNTCTTKPGCTCDPCKNVRDDIQDIEKKNLEVIYIGTEIQQKNTSGSIKGQEGQQQQQQQQQEEEIMTSIREEQRKAYREIKLIKEEIGKLERAELFMLGCPIWTLQNLADFLETKDGYERKKWTTQTTNFWKSILLEGDWASFYCPVSGSIWGATEEAKERTILPERGDPNYDNILEGLTQEEREQLLEQDFPNVEAPAACTVEMPIGEVFDRTERIGYKLIERLTKLVALSEELTKAVEDLHVLISQCSSRGPSSDPPREGCWSICHKTALGVCIKYCQGNPCPDQAIEQKFQEIKNIVNGIPNDSSDKKKDKEGIKDVFEGKRKTADQDVEDDQTREQVGIKAILDEVVPKILEDLQKTIRDPMRLCLASETEKGNAIDCYSAINGLGPEGRIIKNCCYREEFFTECLSECYLSTGYKDYKKCMKRCLEKEARKRNIEDIATCLHLINFYCCTVE